LAKGGLKDPAKKAEKDRKNTIDHTLYEFKRILDQKGIELDPQRLASLFFQTLGKFYQKISKFKKF
jgi:hypothetical protein